MRKILIICLLLCSVNLLAEEKDSTLNKWIPKGVAGINISQIALSNWTQGGDNAMTYTLVGNFGLDYKTETFEFTNGLKVMYGQTKIGDAAFKTNDNEFYLETVYSRHIGWKVDPYISNTVRTTVAPGYEYSDEGDKQIAAFFDPGYISQSIGFTYNKSKIVKTRLGLGFQETFTNEFTNYSDDPETPVEIEDFKFETGIESVTDLEWGFMEDMLLKSKLRLFTRFDHLDVWDLRWDNILSAKINKFFSVNLNVIVIYEKSQSVETQVKEALQLGFSVTLF